MSKIRLNNVRLAFPALFEAATVQGEGEPAFSAAFLLPSDHPQIEEIELAQEALGKEKWGAKWPTIRKEIVANNRLALKDGDTKSSYAGYEGNLFINARNKTRPTVIGRDKAPLTEKDGVVYAGCFVNAVIELWAQDNNYGKRINASLSGVQFLRDGEAFSGGRPASVDDFDDVADVGEEEALV
jgi:hypothetical protein